MKKELIIKDKREFNSIISDKKTWVNSHFAIYIRKKRENHSRFGIAVSTKLGNAVTRNRLKRQIRNLIVDNMLVFTQDFDYIIMVRRQCLNDNYQTMSKSLKKLLKEKVKNEK